LGIPVRFSDCPIVCDEEAEELEEEVSDPSPKTEFLRQSCHDITIINYMLLQKK
jgi:hypothetical protein